MTIMIESEVRWLDCLDAAMRFVKMRETAFDAEEILSIAGCFYKALVDRDRTAAGPQA